ncbi:MAG: aspartate/glutamate racemase family protein [Pseudochelatococcus sp.]|jgi:hypothetical protein|uniref:aspartate/glutamate racemase family protein n=1 Tax=Pseudochelatococcus sp. TaxID=2020869 RepID=UPI003D8F3E07
MPATDDITPAPALGILMLDTAFHRPAGDVGHRETWPFDVLFRTVGGAAARKIVGGDDADLIDAFVEAGEALRAEGAVGLTTSCGFLACRQRTLSARLSIPIATSSLMQLPMIERSLPGGKRAGVITYDAQALTERHFAEVGADPSTPRVGLPENGILRRVIEHAAPYDAALLRADVLSSVRKLLDGSDGIGAIVLECTNLPPFAADIAREYGLPVYDIVTLGRWFHSGLVQQRFAGSA